MIGLVIGRFTSQSVVYPSSYGTVFGQRSLESVTTASSIVTSISCDKIEPTICMVD